ncbi:MAG: hypothetical protein WBA28_01405, partial [Microbacteriaceae bacterium]
MQAIADWWNSISLRTKVTGVTVLMLTLGLLISGIGTSALLRNYLVDQVDSRLKNASQDWQSILGPGASPDNEDCVSFSATEYFWAIYTADGALFCENWANRPAATRPAIESLTYEETEALRGSIFSVNSSVEGTGWRLISVPLQSQIGNSTYSLVIG